MEDVLKIVVELDCGSIEELRADVTNKLDTNISVELLRKCLYGCQLLGLIDENGKRIVEDKDLKSRITVLITDGVPARSGNEWQEEEETYERILVQDWLHLKRLLGHAGYPGSNGHSVMVDVLKIVVESNCTNLEELTNLVVSRVLNRSTELLKKCIW